jgi:preprotein translocase subunit SecE
VARKRGAKKQPKKQAAKRQPARKQPRKTQRLFRETIGELRKVSWPTRKEAINLTYVVVIVMIVMAIFLGGIDFVFFRLFGLLFSR